MNTALASFLSVFAAVGLPVGLWAVAYPRVRRAWVRGLDDALADRLEVDDPLLWEGDYA